MDTQTLIATLEAAPGIIIGLVREVPPENLKRRPAPNKWSAHEHACHISTGQATFLSRLELMLSEPFPKIKSMEQTPEEEAGSMLTVESCIPVIPSADLERSLRFWVEGLGLTVDREMRRDGKLIGCMVHNNHLSFWLNERAGAPIKPEDYEGIRLYWAPSDIHEMRK